METILGCLGASVFSGVLCFVVEKSDKINVHIDRHQDAFLAGLTGAVTVFFASLILINISRWNGLL